MHRPTLTPLRILASASLVLGLTASRAHADTGGGPPASTIRVTGQGSVTSRPDRAEIDLGVVTRADTSEQAAAENARVVRNVFGALRGVLGPNAEIETISYTLSPDYQYPPQGQPRITGYTATNVVRVTQDELSRLGPVIDAATRAGANQIQRIRFTLKDEAAAKAGALRMAALDARAKASSLARALGLQIVRTRSVEETGPMPRPMYELAMARAEAPTTPIIPGTIETTAMVTLTVDFGTPR